MSSPDSYFDEVMIAYRNGGGGGSVSDVQVNGVSVVEDGVANITMSSGGGALLVEAELQGQKYYTKTKAADIFAAFSAGQPVIIHFLPDEQFVPEDTVIMMAYMQHTNNQYTAVLSYEEGTFHTNGNVSEDGYIEFSVQ